MAMSPDDALIAAKLALDAADEKTKTVITRSRVILAETLVLKEAYEKHLALSETVVAEAKQAVVERNVAMDAFKDADRKDAEWGWELWRTRRQRWRESAPKKQRKE